MSKHSSLLIEAAYRDGQASRDDEIEILAGERDTAMELALRLNEALMEIEAYVMPWRGLTADSSLKKHGEAIEQIIRAIQK